MILNIPFYLGRFAFFLLKQAYEFYIQLTSLKKILFLIGIGLIFSGCTTYNPFYDKRSEKVAEQVKGWFKGFDPLEKNIFKDKSTEKKVLKDFEHV